MTTQMVDLTKLLLGTLVTITTIYACKITYLYVQETKQVSYLQGKMEMMEYNLEMLDNGPYTKGHK